MTTLGEKLREAIEKKQVQATLNAWDKHEDQIRKPQQEKAVKEYNFKASNNIMRTTFEHIKNNPNKLPRYHIDELMKQGFKESSATSVVYQLIKAGQVKKDTYGQLTVTQGEYTPIKQAVRVKKEKAPERKKVILIKRTKREDPAHGIAALTPDTGVVKAEGEFKFHQPRAFIPSAIVDQLPVLHARELYDYLKKIFGGN